MLDRAALLRPAYPVLPVHATTLAMFASCVVVSIIRPAGYVLLLIIRAPTSGRSGPSVELPWQGQGTGRLSCSPYAHVCPYYRDRDKGQGAGGLLRLERARRLEAPLSRFCWRAAVDYYNVVSKNDFTRTHAPYVTESVTQAELYA